MRESYQNRLGWRSLWVANAPHLQMGPSPLMRAVPESAVKDEARELLTEACVAALGRVYLIWLDAASAGWDQLIPWIYW